MKHRKDPGRFITAGSAHSRRNGRYMASVLYVEATNLSTVVCALPNLFLELVEAAAHRLGLGAGKDIAVLISHPPSHRPWLPSG